jgi:hypothetical protein
MPAGIKRCFTSRRIKMKKIVCILVLVCVIMGAAFAQQRPATPAPAAPATPAAPAAQAEKPKEKKNSLGLDLFQLFKGFVASDSDSKYSVFIISADYERLVAPHFSFGVDLDLYFLKFDKVDGSYLGISAEGRYYPQSTNFEKFFLGTTIGYNQLAIDGKAKPENGGFSGLTVSMKAGYKLITKGNMCLEPSLAYVLSKSPPSLLVGSLFGASLPSVPTPLGWNAGLRLGFVF